MPSKIEWTDETWNPVRGCSIVSAGCTNCYAMKQAHRFSGPGGAYEGLTKSTAGGPVWTGEIRLVPELLEYPLRWRRRRLVFVNSMSDLFHPDVPDEFIDRTFAAMAAGHRHVFQILTKRPDRMRRYINDLAPGGEVDPARWDAARRPLWVAAGGISSNLQEWIGMILANPRWPLPNVALGVSVENQATAEERIPPLLDTPTAVRWISAEPLLGPVDLSELRLKDLMWLSGLTSAVRILHDGGVAHPVYRALDWVVAGGESGSGARPMHPDWIRSLRDQCVDAGVPFFFKQWGAWSPEAGPFPMLPVQGTRDGDNDMPGYRRAMYKAGKKRAGRSLDGQEWAQMPELFRH